MSRKFFPLVAMTAALACQPVFSAVSDGVVRLGVMEDLSGPYKDINGPGTIVAVEMAVEDHGKSVLGKPVEVVSGDLRNRPDVGSALARKWYDQDGVDAIFGLGSSAVALAVQKVTEDRKRLQFNTSTATGALTGEACSPNAVHWTYDTYSNSKGTAGAIHSRGGDKWFFITVDYAFGHAMEEDAGKLINSLGGEVLGSVRHPINSTDFASALLRAQSSGANVIALANAGNDTIISLQQAQEFGLVGEGGPTFAGMLTLIPDIHAVGLEAAQGLLFTLAYYWDYDDETRGFAEKFRERHGRPPTMVQAAAYSAANHYLKAISEAGTDEADAVMKAMKELPVNDFMTKDGWIRDDGRMMRDLYLVEAKTPAESSGDWDLLKVVDTIPAEEAFRPVSESECPLVQ